MQTSHIGTAGSYHMQKVCIELLLQYTINSTYGADVVVVQYIALNKLHNVHISSYMHVLDKQSVE